MLPFAVSRTSLRKQLQRTDKPKVLYGMGNGADRILDFCSECGISICGVFASDEFVRGQDFRGFTVCRYSDCVARWGDDFVILIAFASELPELLDRFRFYASRHETYAPHVPLFPGDEVVSEEWLVKYEDELTEAYNLLADERSRKVFREIINYKLTGDMSYLFNIETARIDDLRELLSFGGEEYYIDGGAYDGDTVREFMQLTEENYQGIAALEPDRKNFAKLQRFAEKENLQNLQLINKGLWQESGVKGFAARGGRMSLLEEGAKAETEVISIDELKLPATYIKLDVEGAEYEVLCGARNTLVRYAPKLFVAAYHHDNDIWRLPMLIRKLQPQYRLYLRKHPYVPAWEVNILATNSECVIRSAE